MGVNIGIKLPSGQKYDFTVKEHQRCVVSAGCEALKKKQLFANKLAVSTLCDNTMLFYPNWQHSATFFFTSETGLIN